MEKLGFPRKATRNDKVVSDTPEEKDEPKKSLKKKKKLYFPHK